jgi:hypothetical protein
VDLGRGSTSAARGERENSGTHHNPFLLHTLYRLPTSMLDPLIFIILHLGPTHTPYQDEEKIPMSPILSYIFTKDTTFTPNQKCSKTILK